MENKPTKTRESEERRNLKYVELFPKLEIIKPKDVLNERRSAMETLVQYAKRYESNRIAFNEDAMYRTETVEDRTPTIGFEEEIHSSSDCGFFESVLMAYNCHFNLRTSPDDWWYCVIRRVAMAIDENSKKEAVRKMFVEHEGKKKLCVDVPVMNIYDVDYPYFFEAMSTEVSRNTKVPMYVECVTADFTSTTPVTRIVSQITLMSSMQEFFEYEINCRCGIPGVEMKGTDNDWKKLLSKLEVLRTMLKPIEELNLTDKWWALVKRVFTKLLQTYRGKPDKKWWSRIMTYNEPNGSRIYFLSGKRGPSGYSGWIVEFLEGKVGLGIGEFCSGIVTVPLEISFPAIKVTEKAALVAGIVGYTVHEGTGNDRASIKPFQGWSLLLKEDSPLRRR